MAGHRKLGMETTTAPAIQDVLARLQGRIDALPPHLHHRLIFADECSHTPECPEDVGESPSDRSDPPAASVGLLMPVWLRRPISL